MVLGLVFQFSPDYNTDSSDEEYENTIGNVPLEWYADLDHIGYNREGKKILKTNHGDEMDRFLSTLDDPESW